MSIEDKFATAYLILLYSIVPAVMTYDGLQKEAAQDTRTREERLEDIRQTKRDWVSNGGYRIFRDGDNTTVRLGYCPTQSVVDENGDLKPDYSIHSMAASARFGYSERTESTDLEKELFDIAISRGD